VHYPIDEWYESPRFFGHIREYTLDELRTMLRWAGMEVIEARYGNSTHLSTRLRGDGSRWHRGFRVNSLRRLIEAGSIAVSAAVPSLRYAMLAVARKPERDR
jgi:hypothetical protein